MIAEKLRKSILQAAIQGKLTEQLPEDGDATDLLAEIREEKARLIKEGKIKKQKPLPEITEDEIPFDIPQNWCWVRFRQVCTKLTDGSHNPPPNTGKGYPVISAKNIKNGEITFHNVDRYTDELGFNKENPRTNIVRGNIIMGIIGGSIGNLAMYKHDVEVIAQRSIAIIDTLINNEYAMVFLKSPLLQSLLGIKTTGTAQGGIYLGELSNLYFPLPPLTEQHRIVKRFGEILSKIDKLEKDEQKLNTMQQQFPKKMKDSLLQSAIQGKLTEQLKSDGDVWDLLKDIQKEKERLIKEGKIKKGKPLPEITEDEIPFDIPENWCWVRLATVTKKIHYGYTASAQTEGIAKLLRITDIQDNKVNWKDVPYCSPKTSELATYQLSNRDIMIARTGGTIGKTFVVKSLSEVAVFASYLIRVIPSDFINEIYLKRYMESPCYWNQLFAKSSGTGQPNVNGVSLSNLYVPVPPIEEQQRIVDRLDQLLPLCDALE